MMTTVLLLAASHVYALRPLTPGRPTLHPVKSFHSKAAHRADIWAVSGSPSSADVPFTLALVAAIACQGALQHGIATGLLNIPQQAITSQLGISAAGLAWSSAVSCFCVGGLAGAKSASSLADARGRKALLALCGVVCILSGALLYLSGTFAIAGQSSLALKVLLVARLVSGVGCGMATVGVPLYLGEVAPMHLRGAFGSLNQLAICAGILVTQGIAVLMLPHFHWRNVVGMAAVLGISQLLALPFLPESPRWSIGRGDTATASRALDRLRGPGAHVATELAEIQSELRQSETSAAAKEAGASSSYTVPMLLAEPSLRLPLAIALVLSIGQQWSGINAVFFYSTGFFQAAGLSNPTVGTLLASGVNLLAMLLAVPLMETVGRKKLLLVGIQGMLASSLLLSAVLAAKAAALAVPSALLNFLAVSAILAFVSAFEVGPGPIPWQIGGEIFPEAPRATAMSFAATVNWLCNAVIGLSFPLMQQRLGSFAFVPFCVILFAWMQFTRTFVPETKGKSIAEIGEELAGIAAGGKPLD